MSLYDRIVPDEALRWGRLASGPWERLIAAIYDPRPFPARPSTAPVEEAPMTHIEDQ